MHVLLAIAHLVESVITITLTVAAIITAVAIAVGMLVYPTGAKVEQR